MTATEGPALPICAIIVSYNRLGELRRCLASLAALRPGIARVVVVDNGSQDGTPAALRTEFPWVELTEAGTNLGPSVARNLGARQAREPILWFLDSDTEIPEASGAARMHALFAADPQLGALGGEALLGADGCSIGVKRLRCGPSGIIQGDRMLGAAPPTAECQVIASCNLMMRAHDFATLGGFDPYYFFFYEDMDLTWRLHAMGRRLLALSPMPVLHHFAENGRVTRTWQHARNRMYFCLKNLPLRQLALLPLHDLGFLLQLDNLRRLLRRARQPAAAVSAVVAEAGAPAAGAARRAAGLVLKLGAILTLGYVALPVVIGPALRARRSGAAASAMAPVQSAALRSYGPG